MNMTELQKLNKWEVQQLRWSTRLRQSTKFRQLGNAVLDYLIYICYVLGDSTGMHLFS